MKRYSKLSSYAYRRLNK